MTTIRWGILGCGDVTEVKSGPAFRELPGSSLVAVMRRDAAKAEDYARRHGVPRWYADAEALIHDPEVDAVYVATPPSSHAGLAIACARAGKPAYVEKPMAISGAECDAMIDAFARADRPLFVAYYRRALPRFLAVRDALPELGTIRAVRVALQRPVSAAERADPLPWRLVPAIAGGGLFVDLASHTLDLLDFLLGPIAEVRALAANQAGLYPAEDAVAMAFRFGSGALGTGSWSFAADARHDSVEIVGDRGHVSFATFDDVPVRIASARGARELRIPHPEHIQAPLIRRVVDELRGEGRAPSTGETAARTTRVIEEALRDFYGRSA